MVLSVRVGPVVAVTISAPSAPSYESAVLLFKPTLIPSTTVHGRPSIFGVPGMVAKPSGGVTALDVVAESVVAVESVVELDDVRVADGGWPRLEPVVPPSLLREGEEENGRRSMTSIEWRSLPPLAFCVADWSSDSVPEVSSIPNDNVGELHANGPRRVRAKGSPRVPLRLRFRGRKGFSKRCSKTSQGSEFSGHAGRAIRTPSRAAALPSLERLGLRGGPWCLDPRTVWRGLDMGKMDGLRGRSECLRAGREGTTEVMEGAGRGEGASLVSSLSSVRLTRPGGSCLDLARTEADACEPSPSDSDPDSMSESSASASQSDSLSSCSALVVVHLTTVLEKVEPRVRGAGTSAEGMAFRATFRSGIEI